MARARKVTKGVALMVWVTILVVSYLILYGAVMLYKVLSLALFK